MYQLDQRIPRNLSRMIEEPAMIERILTHLGLDAQRPPRAPVWRFDLLQAACLAYCYLTFY
jgi:hypothetical protein